jgi:excisionase family DNA binding protein
VTDDERDASDERPSSKSRTYSVTEAAELLGIHRETAYLQIAANTFPVQAIRVGRQFKIPRAPLNKMLGIDDPD